MDSPTEMNSEPPAHLSHLGHCHQTRLSGHQRVKERGIKSFSHKSKLHSPCQTQQKKTEGNMTAIFTCVWGGKRAVQVKC